MGGCGLLHVVRYVNGEDWEKEVRKSMEVE